MTEAYFAYDFVYSVNAFAIKKGKIVRNIFSGSFIVQNNIVRHLFSKMHSRGEKVLRLLWKCLHLEKEKKPAEKGLAIQIDTNNRKSNVSSSSFAPFQK